MTDLQQARPSRTAVTRTARTKHSVHLPPSADHTRSPAFGHGAPRAAVELEASALIEQAKGVLMSRYDIDAAEAAGLLLVWSAQQRVTPTTVADVLVNEICQGREPMTEPQLVRWLEHCLRSLP